MRQWVRVCVVAGASVSLSWLSGCRTESDDPHEAAQLASEQELEAFDPALARNLPPGVAPEAAQQGRERFIVCATCHGSDARGTQLGPPLRDHEWVHIDGSYEEIQRVIREGIAVPEEYPVPMPVGGGGEFDDEQLAQVAAYVYALSR